MVRAWYGVVQTGQLAGYALDHLAELGKEEFLSVLREIDMLMTYYPELTP